ncbi:MAG: putative DNA binding domain-containing protein [Anaerolineales bacterium]|nr:putative DNA binding domain-containing protein [Anaerolineales bacterium]
MVKKRPRAALQWRTIDLHLHTSASSDYQQMEVTFLDILQRAEARSLDIIAITDHNTVAGYRRLEEEIEQLELLERLNRLLPEEKERLAEYRRLKAKILILPGFEFTATFGFHILAIFSPQKSSREIEHLLLDLRISPDQLDAGSATVGATTDVLTAYRLIRQAGGIVIAAHVNSSNGVAMRGFPLGGQTKIAYTQDENLHALEVTDLENKSRNSTAAFFNGSKPEYPRRMHCIQGSDAHRLTMDPLKKKHLGVGDRPTEVLLPEVSFEALKELFESKDFTRTRPRRVAEEPLFDQLRSLLEEGPNIIQDFYESFEMRGGKLNSILADVCAFANTNGGTLYIGVGRDVRKPIVGVADSDAVIAILEREIGKRINPPVQFTLDTIESGSKKIVRVFVPRGDDPPYALDENKIYVRLEGETSLAVRDEIVNLVKRSLQPLGTLNTVTSPAPEQSGMDIESFESVNEEESPPRTGVEVVSMIERGGQRVYTLRDLRNGNVVHNVTSKSARRLWQYAIERYSKLPDDLSQLQWSGNLGLLSKRGRRGQIRYDLVSRSAEGVRWFFGVTEDGIHGKWRSLVGQEDE